MYYLYAENGKGNTLGNYQLKIFENRRSVLYFICTVWKYLSCRWSYIANQVLFRSLNNQKSRNK